jgi:hypothetical protein
MATSVRNHNTLGAVPVKPALGPPVVTTPLTPGAPRDVPTRGLMPPGMELGPRAVLVGYKKVAVSAVSHLRQELISESGLSADNEARLPPHLQAESLGQPVGDLKANLKQALGVADDEALRARFLRPGTQPTPGSSAAATPTTAPGALIVQGTLDPTNGGQLHVGGTIDLQAAQLSGDWDLVTGAVASRVPVPPPTGRRSRATAKPKPKAKQKPQRRGKPRRRY